MDKNSKIVLGIFGLGAAITAVVLATQETQAGNAPPGTASLSGSVIDSIMLTGVSGVLITLGNLSVHSDSTGKFTFPDVSLPGGGI
jgi:hypothetical protein